MTTRRPAHRPRLAAGAIGCALVLLGGTLGIEGSVDECAPGPPEEEIALDNAVPSSDGRIAVFAFRHIVFSRSMNKGACEARLPPRTVLLDLRGNGIYDLESQEVRILHRHPVPEGARSGQGDYSYGIYAICWDKVVVGGGGRKVRGYSTLFWLDLKTGQLKPLPFYAELAQRGLQRTAYFYIVDRQGTIVLSARRLKPRADPPQGTHGELWVRRPSGRYDNVGFYMDLSALGDGRLFFRSPFDGGYVLYDIGSGTPAKLSPREGRQVAAEKTMGPVSVLRARWCPGSRSDISVQAQGETFEIGRVGAQGWELTTARIDREVLKGAATR